MNKLRLAALALVMAGLAPGTWLRSPPVSDNFVQELHIAALRVHESQLGPLKLLGAWQLTSPNSRFGGYSGLVVLSDGRLLAATDRGQMLIFSPPGGPKSDFQFALFARFDFSPWGLYDLETLTRDPRNGRIWAAYESANRILRIDANFTHWRMVTPGAMQSWPRDYGPEAMTRLADGRFILLAEQSPRWFARTSPGLLFPADPTEGGEPLRFEFVRPSGYSPTDMAQLPDRTVIMLLRQFRFGLPPRFPGKIAVADPRAIRPGGTWRAHVLGELTAPLPSDNYEGIAVEPQRDGSAIVWVISDDNRSPLQRTLLLKFRWAPTQKAPGSTERL